MQTKVDVRVIARGGKYLGDDIGGALITIRDALTGELLATGHSAGGSGLPALMDVCVTQAEVLPVDQASVFSTSLEIDEPRLIRVTAFGPLAAQQSANRVSLTQWVYPGRNIAGGTAGFLLEIPGLIVQVLNPPTHFLPKTAPGEIDIRANVTMMCGCPIGVAPWNPNEFEVTVRISGTEYLLEAPMTFDTAAPYGAPSQFTYDWTVPANGTNQSQIYDIVVAAFQSATGNTGVDRATVIIPAAATS